MIVDKTIRRGSFTSIKTAAQRTEHLVAAYNKRHQPFEWAVTANSILRNCLDFGLYCRGAAQLRVWPESECVRL
ncbi:MAG: hypothetical protein KGL42_15370, partial [Betaproteobacteria bacterium]|nr:hypothetical protein [Betaproteobacteria bacterium]